MATFYHEGDTWDYVDTTGATVGGAVVNLGPRTATEGKWGVVQTDLAQGELGAARVRGVFVCPAAAALGAVDQGQAVSWSGTEVVAGVAGATHLGLLSRDKLANDTVAYVDINSHQ